MVLFVFMRLVFLEFILLMLRVIVLPVVIIGAVRRRRRPIKSRILVKVLPIQRRIILTMILPSKLSGRRGIMSVLVEVVLMKAVMKIIVFMVQKRILLKPVHVVVIVFSGRGLMSELKSWRLALTLSVIRLVRFIIIRPGFPLTVVPLEKMLRIMRVIQSTRNLTLILRLLSKSVLTVFQISLMVRFIFRRNISRVVRRMITRNYLSCFIIRILVQKSPRFMKIFLIRRAFMIFMNRRVVRKLILLVIVLKRLFAFFLLVKKFVGGRTITGRTTLKRMTMNGLVMLIRRRVKMVRRNRPSGLQNFILQMRTRRKKLMMQLRGSLQGGYRLLP